MLKQIQVCDRCGTQSENMPSYTIGTQEVTSPPQSMQRFSTRLDLCGPCLSAMLQHMHDSPADVGSELRMMVAKAPREAID